MSLGTQTITDNNGAWVPPADIDISHPIKIEMWGHGGRGWHNQADPTTGGAGGGGGGYAAWDAIQLYALSDITGIDVGAGLVTTIGITNADIDGLLFANSGGDAGTSGTGGAGGSGGDGSDLPPDHGFSGGVGGNGGGATRSGGGGGGGADSGGDGERGGNGAVLTGGAGGIGGDPAGGTGGAGADDLGEPQNGQNYGGGGGGASELSTTHSLGGPGKIVITYTILGGDTGARGPRGRRLLDP